MLSSVLVPLDGTRDSEQVLDLLVPLLPDQARVEVLVAAARGAAHLQRHAQEVTRGLLARGFAAEASVVAADPGDAILARIAASSPSLVAMQTHARRGAERWLHASVTERILREGTAPLLITAAGHRLGPVRRILVALDGSPEAEGVVPLVRHLALAQGASVTLLRVEVPALVLALAPSGALTAPFVEQAPRSSLTARLRPVRDRLRQAGIEDVRAVGAVGEPASSIVAAAASGGYDLLALTTHQRRGIDRWMFGSVAEQVLRAAPVPLLVQPIPHPR